jgi:hypothetical protein
MLRRTLIIRSTGFSPFFASSSSMRMIEQKGLASSNLVTTAGVASDALPLVSFESARVESFFDFAGAAAFAGAAFFAGAAADEAFFDAALTILMYIYQV